jgi:Nuclear cap-binding protein subunit 3
MRGVDNLSTDDVRLFTTTLYSSFEFKVEWIDDTSLNLVYESADIATSALQALSSAHIEQLPLTTLRPAKTLAGEKTIEGLKLRIAFVGDKKEKGARDRSRWYLFNPHPSEEYERRYIPPYILANDRRDSRRRGERRYDPYPRRRRSRSKSPPLNYDDSPRNEGIELFPSKLSNVRQSDRPDRGSRSRSPDRRRRIEGSHPAFADLVHTVSSTDQPRRSHRTEQPIDLFPDKVGDLNHAAMDSLLGTPRNGPVSLEDRILPGEERSFHDVSKNVIELFPDRVQSSPVEGVSSKSLAERIQEDGHGGAKELFPEMLRRGGGGRRRRRAEDHF